MMPGASVLSQPRLGSFCSYRHFVSRPIQAGGLSAACHPSIASVLSSGPCLPSRFLPPLSLFFSLFCVKKHIRPECVLPLSGSCELEYCIDALVAGLLTQYSRLLLLYIRAVCLFQNRAVETRLLGSHRRPRVVISLTASSPSNVRLKSIEVNTSARAVLSRAQICCLGTPSFGLYALS